MNFTVPVSQPETPCQEVKQMWIDDFKMVKSSLLVKILLGILTTEYVILVFSPHIEHLHKNKNS